MPRKAEQYRMCQLSTTAFSFLHASSTGHVNILSTSTSTLLQYSMERVYPRWSRSARPSLLSDSIDSLSTETV